MRHARTMQVLLVITLGLPILAWGQGGGGRQGRGNQAQQQAAPPAQQQAAPPAAAAAGRGGGGRGGEGGAAATDEFYSYDTSASSPKAVPDSGPETHQKMTLNGSAFAYTAQAGFLTLHNATTGQSEAYVFYTSYAKEGSDSASRPLVFFLGGAPGVAASWQEFGGLGPKRMKEGMPYGWSENPNTLLGQADLVFVNPVGTAFSRAVTPNHAPSFWTTAADIASLGDFVRGYVNKYSRWNSPLFLAGEDLGTGRVAGLATYLIEHEVPVRGVMLLSMSLSGDATSGDAEYLTLMPSFTTAAWFHKKLSPDLAKMDLEQLAGQARTFASREYLHALYKGDRMTAAERTKAIDDLSHLTGLSKPFIVNNDLRISLDRFNTEILHDQHAGLSRSDARVSGYLAGAGGGRGGGGGGGGGFFGAPAPPLDFNLSGMAPGFLTAYESYLRTELNFKSGDEVFYLMSGGVGTFTATGNDDASLSGAFARNPHMHLFVAINYFDLNAPFYATEFTLAHLNVSPDIRAHNIHISHYEAGQMTYSDPKGLEKLHQDLASFIGDATSK